jgi:Fic family protein
MLKNCTPIHLPPDLDWRLFALELGYAHKELALYDETLRSIPSPVLEILKWEDSIANVQSDIKTGLLEVLQFALVRNEEEKRADLLQKIIHAKEGLDFAISWSFKKPLNLSFLCKLQTILKTSGPNPLEIGRLRKRQNWIGAKGCSKEKAYFIPPKAHLVPKYIKDWESYQKKNEEPFVQLAILFAQLLVIHPFMDANGRVARDHIPAFLYKKKCLSQPYLFLSSYFQEHRSHYVQKLFNISEKNDWESWILFFLKGVTIQSQKMNSQAKRLYELYLKVGKEEPFIHPVALRKKKHLTRNSKGIFIFDPLFEIVQ